MSSTVVAGWSHDACMTWLRSLPSELGLKLDRLAAEADLDGMTLLSALDSTREMRDVFGLDSMRSRLLFERALRAVMAGKPNAHDDGVEAAGDADDVPAWGGTRPSGTRGGVYDESFLRIVQPLYDMHMGVENMGPLLYSLVRFLKPRSILEVGAGYTSIWILQALRDNYDEMHNYQWLQRNGQCHCEGTPWCVVDYLEQPRHYGTLHCVDNLEHEHTTAGKVLEAAEALDLLDYLDLHFEDAWDYIARLNRERAAFEDRASTPEPDAEPSHHEHDDDDDGEHDEADTTSHAAPAAPLVFDLVWLDFGAGQTLANFFDRLWPHVRSDGGFVLVHSTLTNRLTRSWLTDMRLMASPEAATSTDDTDDVDAKVNRSAASPASSILGAFSTMTFYEPHKLFQNSVSLFQKRYDGYAEPIYTNYP